MDEMSVEKWWNEICSRGKREKPREKPTQTSFCPPRNPHGVTETRTLNPSGGKRAPNRLRHEAAKPCKMQHKTRYVKSCKKSSCMFFSNISEQWVIWLCHFLLHRGTLISQSLRKIGVLVNLHSPSVAYLEFGSRGGQGYF